MLQVDLSDEILSQIGAGSIDSPNRFIKFDAKGTVHVMYRDEDGKLVKDLPVSETGLAVAKQEASKEEQFLNTDISTLKNKNRILRIYFLSILIVVVFAVAVSIGMLKALG